MEALLVHLPRKPEGQPHTYNTDRLALCLTYRLACVSDAFHKPKRGPITTDKSSNDPGACQPEQSGPHLIRCINRIIEVCHGRHFGLASPEIAIRIKLTQR